MNMKQFIPLPKDFIPGDKDVVINKGKRFFHHKGNKWLRDIATSMIDEYAVASTKLEKSLIISDVVEHVRLHGSFVRKDSDPDGGWVHAEELLCREKTSAVFRDALQQQQRKEAVAISSKKRMADVMGQQQHQPLIKQEQQDSMVSMDNKRQKMDMAPLTVSFDFDFDFDFSLQAPETKRMPMTDFVAPPPSVPTVAVATADQSWSPGDLFSVLANAFGNVEEDGNPFEPRPLMYEL